MKSPRRGFRNGILGLSILALLAASAPGCRPEAECVLGGSRECSHRYAGRTPFLRFPFAPEHPVLCSHEKNPMAESLFAIDLATPSEAEPPGEVHAALEGTALVHEDCGDEKRPGQANQDSCGQGLGNHVRVVNADGFLVLYAHLGKVLVKDGQVVAPGDLIGLEGKSGEAKTRHLHLSIHHGKIDSWPETLARLRRNPGWVPASIPFETQYCDPGVSPECKRARNRVEKMPCDSKRPAKLRADWR